jgi:2-oxoglutarate dehydrogenase E2 component (dihydrolipoamide succinyltransferase)
MPTEIKMPQLGESVTEGTVGRWLKRPGDAVAKYQPLLEVITDKVDSEVPSPVAGTLLEIVVAEGETVRVGTVLAYIGVTGEARTESAVQSAEAVSDANEVVAEEAAAAPMRNNYLSPVVARLVAEHGLDVSRISGTGANGRISKQDVLRYLEADTRSQKSEVRRQQTPDKRQETADEQQATAAVQDAFAIAPTLDRSTAPTLDRSDAPTLDRANASTLQRSNASTLDEDSELVPLTPMRRSIAEHMVRSIRTAPHVTTVMEVDLSRVLAHRERNKAQFEQQGVRLTFTPYFVQATATALQAVPLFNGSFSDGGIVLNHRIHIGVAVALDEGLLVPVIRDADEKNLLGLSRQVNDLAVRARNRRLKPEETQGGTFTITNHGVSGSIFATPIINQPQAAILGVGAIVKRPIIVTQDGSDAITIRPMAYLSLTFDHRIADGAAADGFLAAIKTALEAYR